MFEFEYYPFSIFSNSCHARSLKPKKPRDYREIKGEPRVIPKRKEQTDVSEP